MILRHALVKQAQRECGKATDPIDPMRGRTPAPNGAAKSPSRSAEARGGSNGETKKLLAPMRLVKFDAVELGSQLLGIRHQGCCQRLGNTKPCEFRERTLTPFPRERGHCAARKKVRASSRTDFAVRQRESIVASVRPASSGK